MSSLSLSGLILDSFKLQDCIGSGAFAHVYKAVELNSGKLHAVKVARDEIARPAETESREVALGEVLSEAIGIYTGGYGEVTPDPARLMALCAERSASVDCPTLVSLSAPHAAGAGGVVYSSMEFIEGTSLRTILRERRATGIHKFETDVFCSVAEQLCDFLVALQVAPMQYHGDLKPENILVQQDNQIRVIDPGYIGALNCREGYLPSVAVTTPFYNPTLEANDTFGFGSTLWELATGHHPLRTSTTAPATQEYVTLSSELETSISMHEMSGRYFLSPLRHLVLPSKLTPSISNDVETILLNALGYAINGVGKLSFNVQPLNFGELKQRIAALRIA